MILFFSDTSISISVLVALIIVVALFLVCPILVYCCCCAESNESNNPSQFNNSNSWIVKEQRQAPQYQGSSQPYMALQQQPMPVAPVVNEPSMPRRGTTTAYW